MEPLSQTEIKRWIAGDRPKGCAIKGTLDDAALFLDAPFFGAEYSNYYIVGADARLNRNDPDYLAKLMKILDNVKSQIGGEWLIEDRDIDVWEPVVSQ